jgi:HD-GYP domain-containing protein (c-di-GMP phosphodiesterase class II)
MIDLPLKKLQPGMVTAQSIYNSSGASYLTRGTELTRQYIDKLCALGINDLHVLSYSSEIKLLPPEDVLSEKTRVMAIQRVYDVFAQVEETGTFEFEPLAKAAAAMVSDIATRSSNLVQLTDIRVHDEYTFAHSVNVAMLSGMLGRLAHLPEGQIQELTLGGLLHDLGKIIVPPEILNKQGRLTKNEFDIIKHHPEAGFAKIRSMSLPDAHMLGIMAMQHHEHMDGTGYPGRRKDREIHAYGRICAIADVYDALTSSRPYKKAYSPAVAYHIMTNCSEGQFDEKLLKLFFSNVAIYPIGTVVKTSEGYGIVKKVEFGLTDRPMVVMYADQYDNILPEPYEEYLHERPEHKIESAVDDSMLLVKIRESGFDPASLL